MRMDLTFRRQDRIPVWWVDLFYLEPSGRPAFPVEIGSFLGTFTLVKPGGVEVQVAYDCTILHNSGQISNDYNQATVRDSLCTTQYCISGGSFERYFLIFLFGQFFAEAKHQCFYTTKNMSE